METESVEERLEKLERTTRRYWLALAGLSLVVAAGAVTWVLLGPAGGAQAQKSGESSKVIRAKGFVLEDENGTARAHLGMNWYGPGLWLYHKNGTAGAQLYVSALSFFDEAGEVRTVLSGESGLDLFDEKGVQRVGLRTYPALLTLSDERGEPRAMLSVLDGFRSALSLCGETGEVGAGACARASLSVLNDKPGVYLVDVKGRTIWSVP